MTRFPFCLCRTLAAPLFFLAVAAQATELRLFAEFNGRSLPIAGVDRASAFCSDGGKKIPVPRDAVWHLEGDLRENARLIDWSPNYSISRVDAPDIVRAKQELYHAPVVFLHATEIHGKSTKSQFLEAWPQGVASAALGVYAWVIGDKIVMAAARPLPPTQRGKVFEIEHEFQLTPAEIGGQAVTLVWANGAFVAPAPRFETPALQSALVAIELGDVVALRAVLKAGLPASTPDRTGYTLLHYATEAGRLESVEALLAAGVKPDVNHWKVPAALHWAIRKNRSEIVDRLLAAGANKDENTPETTPLHDAITSGADEIALRLVRAKVDLGAEDHVNRIPQTIALDAGMAEVVRAMMLRGSKPDFDDEQMARVLISQASRGHTAMVRLLLENKVKPNFMYQGMTPMMAGAKCGDPEIVRALLAAGASAKQARENGFTPLMAAATSGSASYAAALIEAGADVNGRRADGVTVLHFAVNAGSGDVVQLLLDRGAKFDVREDRNVTPLQVALRKQARGIVTALTAKGAKLDMHDPGAAEDLKTALSLDAAPLIRSALADGWPADTKFDGGWPALKIAEICGARACAELLRSAGAKATPADSPPMASMRELDVVLNRVKDAPLEDPRDLFDKYPGARVDFDIVVDANGQVRFPRTVGNPNLLLTSAALNGVLQWKFDPPLRSGQPVAVKARVPVVFPSAEEQVYDNYEVDVTPVPRKQARAVYPEELRQKGYGGVIRLRCVVNVEGHPEHIRVLSSAHPELENAAVKAVEKWTFKPGELDGKPVSTWVEVSMIFTMD